MISEATGDAIDMTLNEVTLWHTSSDITALESFLDNGAQAIGIGRGGQTSGFFVWNKKESAISHFTDFLGADIEAEGLLVGVTIDKNNLVYPDWQFDVEASKDLNVLLFKYKDEISKIKNLNYKDFDGEEKKITSIEISPFAKEECCYFMFHRGQKSSCLAIGDGDICGVDMFQALIDKMCQNSDFRNDYNKLLQEKAIGSTRLALKYCGKEALSVNEISFIQKKEQDKSVEHVIYRVPSDINKEDLSQKRSQKQKLCKDLLQLKTDILREKLGGKLGKTANKKDGKIHQENIDTAQIQTTISKLLMVAKRKMEGK